VLFWTPDDVPEHPTVVHLQFLELTKTGFFFNLGLFFNEVIIHDLMMKI
jgi:hypothetical protein